jgi:HK97 gp10 family phage protein
MRIDVSDLVSALGDVEEQVLSSIDEQSLRAIGFAGAEVIMDEAKRNASRHVRTGTLAKNIITKRLEEKSDGDRHQTYLITVRKGRYGIDGDAYYAGWVENGHKIVPRKPEGVSWRAHRTAAEWEYGGATVPAYPFLRPACSKQESAIDAMSQKLADQLQRNATRGGRQR